MIKGRGGDDDPTISPSSSDVILVCRCPLNGAIGLLARKVGPIGDGERGANLVEDVEDVVGGGGTAEVAFDAAEEGGGAVGGTVGEDGRGSERG